MVRRKQSQQPQSANPCEISSSATFVPHQLDSNIAAEVLSSSDLKRSRRESPNRREYAAFLYSSQVKGLYRLGFSGETNSGRGKIHVLGDGAPKYIVDILGFPEFANALCLTLNSLPFVKAFIANIQTM
jgi:hypothetical protein